MAKQFKVGDRVRFDHDGLLAEGVVHAVGSETVIISVTNVIRWVGSPLGRDMQWYVPISSVSPVVKLSPLEQQVRDYCDKELGRANP